MRVFVFDGQSLAVLGTAGFLGIDRAGLELEIHPRNARRDIEAGIALDA